MSDNDADAANAVRNYPLDEKVMGSWVMLIRWGKHTDANPFFDRNRSRRTTDGSQMSLSNTYFLISLHHPKGTMLRAHELSI